MTAQDEEPTIEPHFFDPAWEGDVEADETPDDHPQRAPAEEDVEAHGISGFNRPE
jgi:hypothetical protein